MSQVKSGVRTLIFGRANFRLLKELLDEIYYKAVFTDKGVEQSQMLFKGAFLRAQELSVYQYGRTGRRGQKPPWFSRNLLVKRREEKNVSPGNRDAVHICTDGIRKAKGQMELHLMRAIGKTTGRGSIGALVRGDRPRRVPLLINKLLLEQIWRRLRYSMSSLLQFSLAARVIFLTSTDVLVGYWGSACVFTSLSLMIGLSCNKHLWGSPEANWTHCCCLI